MAQVDQYEGRDGGHWTQQERPEEVNVAMIDFLKGL
jgi:pimeloyl-ACP methyl ester carboxylesterase